MNKYFFVVMKMIKSNSFFVNAAVLKYILQFLLNKIFLKLGIIIKC